MKVGRKERKKKTGLCFDNREYKERGSKLDLLISSPYYEVDVLLG